MGDVLPAAALTIRGEALLPPAPVHLTAGRLPNGDVAIAWTRRSRLGWVWTSGADTPLGEEREQYRLAIAGAGFERIAVTDTPSFTYSAAQQVADGASGMLALSVRQAGDHGLSHAAAVTFE